MNRYLVERLQPFGTTIFAEMSALAVETECHQSRAGLPRHRRSRRREAGGRRRDPSGAQPVPARHRHPRAARRDPRAPATVLRTRVRRRHRGPGHRRRDRGDRGRTARAVRSGRRGRHVRAVLRLLRGVHRDVRCDATRRHVARARLRVRSRRAARGDHFAHQAHPAQLSAQSDRQGLHPGRAGTHRGARARARPARRHRRGLRAPRLRRRARTDGDPAGNARPHRHDRIGWQDVLVHRLEGRLGMRAARARDRGEDREAVPHLREQRSVPVRDRRGPAASRRVLHGVPPRDARQARSALRRSGRCGLRRCSGRRARIS